MRLLQEFMRHLLRHPTPVVHPLGLPERWETCCITTARAKAVLRDIIDKRFEREIIHVPQLGDMGVRMKVMNDDDRREALWRRWRDLFWDETGTGEDMSTRLKELGEIEDALLARQEEAHVDS